MSREASRTQRVGQEGIDPLAGEVFQVESLELEKIQGRLDMVDGRCLSEIGGRSGDEVDSFSGICG